MKEHHDVMTEVDSIAEPTEEARCDEDTDTGFLDGSGVDDERVEWAQRECCAAALENGMNGHGNSYRASMPSQHKRDK